MSRLTIPPIALGLAGVTAAGLIVRTIPIALTDFPVNDGGLFVAMTRAITEAGWMLPATVGWNGQDLPFTYPPAAFYLSGVLEAVGADLFGVFRWLPLLASTLIVPAVYLLGRELHRSALAGLAAAFAYALAPSSFVWMIQGGGVTRSPGLLLAVLALWQLVALVRVPDRRRAFVVGVLAGATALVHPGATVFVAISGVLIWFFEGRSRESLAWAGVAVGVGALIAAPWAVTTISRHGLSALTDVPSNGPNLVAALLAVLAGRVTGVPFLDPLAILGLGLAILCLIRRRWLLPLWFVVAIAMSYQYAMIPFGLLFGVAAKDLIAMRREAARSGRHGPGRWIPSVGVGLLVGCFAIEAVSSAMTVQNRFAPVHALSADRRQAMDWAATNLEEGATVAVITNSVWSGDPDSEWFPLLVERQSVATVQGTEWLGKEAFAAQQRAHRSLQACVRPASVACVTEWLTEWPSDYLYLPKGPLHGPNSPEDCCADLRAGLLADSAFTPVYDGPGATILSANLTRAHRPATADGD